MKCQACHEEQAEWSWQPFGPGENASIMTLPGSHYRGFPVIKIGFTCKSAVETGDFPVQFTYKGYRYAYTHGEVKEINPSFYDGGTTDLNGGSATMVMKDGPEEDILVALVAEPEFIPAIVAVPDLVKACEEIAEVFTDSKELSLAQHMALAQVRNVLALINKK